MCVEAGQKMRSYELASVEDEMTTTLECPGRKCHTLQITTTAVLVDHTLVDHSC
ncbi:hypothetical protein PGT21_017263 [Puccinia graminis f. sp. tritici]|uniref:Uncharacterized protein n=1 Tax=Puccinia graminis f. sp. tritici TaxID=56615 RepID=A0A5B0PP27_PUCGR|nr:hypothetical protein PGT21_017442 [Puccinia graminis f. sp. tritici]KAA1103415.1 hypothetical protein PGT21_017263 [Puccinia graminis f. sp. tritici]